MKTIMKLLAGWMMLFIFQPMFAQNLMVIHQGNGTKIQLPLESIDSIRFVSLPPPVLQKIFQNNGNVLALAVSDIDSITYDLPNPQSLPQVSTQAVTALGTSSVYAQGAVLSDGGSPVTQRGFCWSLQPMPSLGNNYTSNGSGSGSFGASITPLQAGTLYYVRAYASNSSGTAYGAQLTVSTQSPSTSGNLPTVSTTPVQYTPAQGLTAICGGNVTADGGLAVTARGVCWAAGTTPTLNHNFTVDGVGAGSFTSNLTGLSPNTLYFVRAYATNDAGTVYGVSYGFTIIGLPILSTTAASAITTTTASSGGNISSDGGGSNTARGVCWSTSQNPTIALTTKTSDGTGTGSFSSNLTGLSPNTLYYVRAYATNSTGTAYGNQVSFTTASITNPVDVDGNTYTTVTIGSQVWMKENLKTTRYRNGAVIPTGLSDSQWQNTNSGAYAIYDNNAANNDTYGKLYNWFAVTDSRNLCPTGWHVPSDAEWTTLENFLGGVNVAGGKMKAVSSLWTSPNTGATDESGFSGLPGGCRFYLGSYFGVGNYGYWWSSTESSTTYAWGRGLGYVSGGSNRSYYYEPYGFGVRCLRD